jgi:uncharacterized protein (TIGR02186 family)
MNEPAAGRIPALMLAAGLLLSSGFVTTTAAAAFASGGVGPASLAVFPKRVLLTSRYHGSTLDVDIVAPSGSDIALKLEGKRRNLVFNKKGRVVVLWMNVGEVTIGNAPQTYMLYTSTALAELAPRETLQRLCLGLDALEPQIEARGGAVHRDTLLLEFYAYMKKRELYRVAYGALRPERGAPGYNGAPRDRCTVRIHLPSRIPVGAYEVDLCVFKDRGLVERMTETVTVEKTGFPLLVSRLAREHPGEYGLLAIIVAVVAGYSVGLVFSYLGRRLG